MVVENVFSCFINKIALLIIIFIDVYNTKLFFVKMG